MRYCVRYRIFIYGRTTFLAIATKCDKSVEPIQNLMLRNRRCRCIKPNTLYPLRGYRSEKRKFLAFLFVFSKLTIPVRRASGGDVVFLSFRVVVCRMILRQNCGTYLRTYCDKVRHWFNFVNTYLPLEYTGNIAIFRVLMLG